MKNSILLVLFCVALSGCSNSSEKTTKEKAGSSEVTQDLSVLVDGNIFANHTVLNFRDVLGAIRKSCALLRQSKADGVNTSSASMASHSAVETGSLRNGSFEFKSMTAVDLSELRNSPVKEIQTTLASLDKELSHLADVVGKHTRPAKVFELKLTLKNSVSSLESAIVARDRIQVVCTTSVKTTDPVLGDVLDQF